MKAIIDGKLYDTETAEEIISYTFSNFVMSKTYQMFRTKNGKYFLVEFIIKSKKILCVEISSRKKYVGDIKLLSEEEAKNIIRVKNVDKYIELFGEVEKG